MLTKSTIFAALYMILGLVVQLADATPPACILACVNEHERVGDMNAICKEETTTMVSCLQRACDAAVLEDAIASYKRSCKEKGIDVVILQMPSGAATHTTASTTTATSTPTITGNTNRTNHASDHDGNGDDSAFRRTYYNSMLALMAIFATAVAL
ncbi:hypothetical protein BDZ91DRAFT_729987 [Kalaharituber pfeilii]|nr:hypothetical protein BDZ91DRAFT_729987 [Kalaharituber pfeilii]